MVDRETSQPDGAEAHRREVGELQARRELQRQERRAQVRRRRLVAIAVLLLLLIVAVILVVVLNGGSDSGPDPIFERIHEASKQGEAQGGG